MPPNLHVFISYRKHDGQTPAFAENIATTLENQYGFEVFLDKLRIDTADNWEQKIYSEIHRSDVLILLLEPETAESEWVQREVDFARGACVCVLPLLVVAPGTVDLDKAIQKLALRSVQHSQHFQHSPKDYDWLASNIRRLALDTRDAQRQQHRQREDHWYSTPIGFTLKHISYQIRNDPQNPLRIHVTVGNILEMPEGTLDVIVNSENDYLQMARYYEINSLSARLRKAGAYFNKGQLIQDTLQHELDAIDKGQRPVQLRQVFVTSAGHEKGELRKKYRLKLIFHAITVAYNIGGMKYPIHALDHDAAIHETIQCCFQKVKDVNADADERLRLSKDPGFDAIRSIALPLFGTGMGGRSIKDVAQAMAGGLYKAILAEGPATLTDIHLLVYSRNEVSIVESALNAYFDVAKS